nr:MAG TPA: hypothetical protein [Caudoviricetes sp.]DAX14501.1 MAG TPA: hypothetical protein [Bacteriophage sp.]
MLAQLSALYFFLSSCYNCVLFVNLSSTFVNLNICVC